MNHKHNENILDIIRKNWVCTNFIYINFFYKLSAKQLAIPPINIAAGTWYEDQHAVITCTLATYELLSCHDILDPSNPFLLGHDEDGDYHISKRAGIDEFAIGTFDGQNTITWHSSGVEHWIKKSRPFECMLLN